MTASSSSSTTRARETSRPSATCRRTFGSCWAWSPPRWAPSRRRTISSAGWTRPRAMWPWSSSASARSAVSPRPWRATRSPSSRRRPSSDSASSWRPRSGAASSRLLKACRRRPVLPPASVALAELGGGANLREVLLEAADVAFGHEVGGHHADQPCLPPHDEAEAVALLPEERAPALDLHAAALRDGHDRPRGDDIDDGMAIAVPVDERHAAPALDHGRHGADELEIIVPREDPVEGDPALFHHARQRGRKQVRARVAPQNGARVLGDRGAREIFDLIAGFATQGRGEPQHHDHGRGEGGQGRRQPERRPRPGLDRIEGLHHGPTQAGGGPPAAERPRPEGGPLVPLA